MEISIMASSTETTKNTEEIASTDSLTNIGYKLNDVCAVFYDMTSTESVTCENWNNLIERAKKPDNKEKSEANVFGCHTLKYKRKVPVIEHNSMTLCWADIDEGNRERATLEGDLLDLGLGSFIVYSSKSSKADNKKWRVLVELENPISIKDWLILQNSFCKLLDADVAACRANQIFYGPNEGEHYEFHINEGKTLGSNMSQVLMDTCLEVKAELKEAHKEIEVKREKAVKKIKANRVNSVGSKGDFTIEMANSHLDTDELFEKYKYVPVGDKWISPNTKQDTPNPGIVLFDDGNWFSFHASDVDAGIGVPGDSGCFGDAFSLMCHYEFGGDASACLAALADLYDKAGQKKRQKQYAKANFAIPGEYVNRADGVFRLDKGKDGVTETQITLKPIEIIAKSRDENAGDWGVMAQWLDLDGIQHRRVFSAGLFESPGEFRKLLRTQGVPIAGSMGKDLVKYLDQFHPTNRVRAAIRTGWLNGVFVLPTQSIGVQPADELVIYKPNEDVYTGAIHSKGSFDEWKKGVKDLSLLPKFMVCVGLSAPIQAVCGVSASLFNIYGFSSGGKTTTAQAAASVFGNGIDPSKNIKGDETYLESWASTKNGYEAVAENYNNLPLVFDEIGLGECKEFGHVAYMLVDGSGKKRLDDGGRSSQRIRRWNCAFVSTGEIAISEFIKQGGNDVKAGQRVRCIDIPTDAFAPLFPGNTNSEQAKANDRAKKVFADHYGFAGVAFIESLDLEKVKAEWQKFPKDCIGEAPCNLSIRVREKITFIAFTGLLAVRAGVLPWSKQEVMDCVSSVYRGWLANTDLLDEEDKAIERIMKFIRTNQSRFYDLNKCEETPLFPRDLAGYFRGDNFYFMPDVFDDICDKANLKKLKQRMVERGQIFKRDKDKFTTKIRLANNKRPRTIAVLSSEYEENRGATGAKGANVDDSRDVAGASLKGDINPINDKKGLAPSVPPAIAGMAPNAPLAPVILDGKEKRNKVLNDTFKIQENKSSNPTQKRVRKSPEVDPNKSSKIKIKNDPENVEKRASDSKDVHLIKEIMNLLNCSKGSASNSIKKAKAYLNIEGKTEGLTASEKELIFNQIKDNIKKVA